MKGPGGSRAAQAFVGVVACILWTAATDARADYCEAPPPAGYGARSVYLAAGNPAGGCYGQYGGVTIVLDGISRSGSTCTLRFHCSNGTHLNDQATYPASMGCPSLQPGTANCVPLQETNEAQTAPPPCPICRDPGVGNPIHPLTGAKKEHVDTGIEIGGLPLRLLYDTTPKLPATQAGVTPVVDLTAFGSLWRSNLHRRLQVTSGLTTAMVGLGTGEIINFTGPGDGTFVAAGGQPHKLTTISGGFRLVNGYTGEISVFNTAGALVSVSTLRGRTLTFAYSGDSLVLVKSDDGRSVRFKYADGRVVRIYAPDGGITRVSYDANANLISLQWPDGNSLIFRYENAQVPWALTGKTDENGSRLATFSYTDQGLAVSTEYAGGVNKYSVEYGAMPYRNVTETFDVARNVNVRSTSWVAPGDVLVTYPNGQSATLSATVAGSLPSLVAQSQPAGSGAPSAMRQVQYDAQGNVASADDFSGVRTCYVYDAFHRETRRVEGLGTTTACASVVALGSSLPAGSRRIDTSWHPDWQLSVVVDESLQRTTRIYNGQPDPFAGNSVANCTSAPSRADGKPLPLLCKLVIQSKRGDGSIDPNVASQVWSSSYDGNGRRVSSTDPRGNSTAYTYYGDTVYSTNAAYDNSFDKVQLLLRGRGVDGTSVLGDDSQNSLAPTLVGAPAVSGAQSKYGGSSLRFNGNGDALSFPSVGTLSLATGDFTIEAWVYVDSLSTSRTVVTKDQVYGASNPSYAMIVNGGGGLSCEVGNGTNGSYAQWFGTPNGVIGVGTWNHVVCSREGTTLRAFVNGSLMASAAQTGTPVDGGQPLLVGRYPQGPVNSWMSGYVDDLRITKGLARYTGNFTPPSSEMPDTGPTLIAAGHAAGDLQSSTNAASQANQFTVYDPAGRVRQMVDAKGVTTDISYTPRGWGRTLTVTSPSGVASRSTEYTFDGVGQVTGVSLPDGTTLQVQYDAAHRLIGITDGRGSSITYTLDTSGNRVGEDVKDATGALRRSVARSFDALNRVQQVTGASE